MSIFSTLEAFRDGLTSTLSPAGGADLCRGWAAKIEAADRPDLLGIRHGLVTLARQLTDQQAEGPASPGRDEDTSAGDIGRTMEQLGAHTAEAADSFDEAHLHAPLRKLGGYLKAAGIALAGGSRPDQIDGISTDVDGTPGDPELRTVNTAPDVSDEALDPDRPGVKDTSGDLSDDVNDVPGDETPGTALNPH
jgi:hypothetical protein